MNARSIRFQLLAWYATLLLVGFTAFGVFMYAALGASLRHNLRDTLTRRAQRIAYGMVTYAADVNAAHLQEEIGLLYAPETSSRFVRVSAGGTNVLYHSGTPQDRSFEPSHVPLPGNRIQEQSVRLVSQNIRTPLLIAQQRVEVHGASYIVEVGATLTGINAVLSNMVKCLLIGAPVLIAVTGLGAYVLIGRALRPVVQIARSAEEITLQNLDERLPVPQTGDELEALSTALNRMISRIREAYDNTRRFVADASHELRTPLAVLRGEIESVITGNHLTPETRETLGSNLEEVERLGKIVEGLFALSRLDAGEAHAETVRFDLAALAATTTEQMCLLAEDKNISLSCESTAPVFVQGDRARLKQVIVNLVDNAIKYTPDRGTVTVRTLTHDAEAILEVRDTGIGVPGEAMHNIFERFYRVDKARSRDQGGAGLGLSIVKSICHAHSGKVTVEPGEKMGTVFRVYLPLARETQLPRPS